MPKKDGRPTKAERKLKARQDDFDKVMAPAMRNNPKLHFTRPGSLNKRNR